MASIEVTIRQDNGVNVTLNANPSDEDVRSVVDAVLEFMASYPMALGSRPASPTPTEETGA